MSVTTFSNTENSTESQAILLLLLDALTFCLTFHKAAQLRPFYRNFQAESGLEYDLLEIRIFIQNAFRTSSSKMREVLAEQWHSYQQK